MTVLCAWCLVLSAGANAGAQGEALAVRVMQAVRAAMAPALPFPATTDDGALPAGGNTEALWMVRPLLPGDRDIDIMANPLNEQNQLRAERAMKQIDQAINAAQRRAEQQYERALAEAKRTGRSQDVDGVTLADEGVAGARIDAESHVSIEVVFNQPSYRFTVSSGEAPAPARQLPVSGAVAVITVQSNVYRNSRDEERYCEAETQVYLGRVAVPSVDRKGDTTYEVTAGGTPSAAGTDVASLVLRFRGNDILIPEIVAKTDWNALLELLK